MTERQGNPPTNDLLPWRHEVYPCAGGLIAVQGVWTPTLPPGATAMFNSYVLNTSNVQNDECAVDLVIAKGTWTAALLAVTDPTAAIATLLFDGVVKTTWDLYSGAQVWNVPFSTAGIVTKAAGVKRVSLKAASRNPANVVGWKLPVIALVLRRSA